MANNASALGTNTICGSSGQEEKVPALSNGALLPGSCCGITAADGKVCATNAGTKEEFVGLLEKSYNKTIDEFQVAGKGIDLIKPRYKKRYLVRIDSANTAAGTPGKPLEHAATATAELMDAATLDDKTVAYLDQVYNGTDDFAWVIWGR